MAGAKGRLTACLRFLRKRGGLIVVAAACVAAGWLLRAAFAPVASPSGPGAGAPAAQAGLPTVWTCSMHPEVRKPGPGKCPKCGMDLIPVRPGGDRPASLREFRTSEQAAALMDIRTAPVQRKFVTAEVRMVGKIAYDETRTASITAWVAGRLVKLYIDYPGVWVKKGDHLVEVYSPELLAAQEALLQAVKAVKQLKETDSKILRDSAEATRVAAREKLRLLGLTAEQIADVVARGKASDHVTIYSPGAGVVVRKHAEEGMWVKTGTPIYTIADLSKVWVKLDAYESDLEWVSPGQAVTFTTVAYPGRPFDGQISFVDPVLDERTRTVKLRLTARNKDGLLKPGMFVKAVARARVGAGGKALTSALAGKWICPHHPDVIENEPGTCSKCGWPLSPAESLYNITDPARADKPLVVPASAVLKTGTRAVVYVQVDPSVLHTEDVADWPGLILRFRAALKAPAAARGEFLNTRCPIMGTKLDLSNVPAALTRAYKGGKVAFCCAGCPEKWDKLSDEQKAAKLAEAAAAGDPLLALWKRLAPALRKALLATPPDEQPPPKVQHAFARAVNDALRDPGFYDAAVWKGVQPPAEARELLRVGADNLPPLRLTRLNRLLLDALLGPQLAPTRAGPTFEGRQIVLGPRAGDYYLVRSGLAEGDRVVVRGNFKIDSALQIQAKPTMMLPEGGLGGAARRRPLPKAFEGQLRRVLNAAEAAAQAVEKHDLAEVRPAFSALGEAVEAVDADLVLARRARLWKELSMRLRNDAVEGGAARTDRTAERVGQSLKANVRALRKAFGLGREGATTQPATQPAKPWTCPMHPKVRAAKPGKCPLCGMDLIRVPAAPSTRPHGAATQPAKAWTCPMHPQIRMDRPGKCPICLMALLPAREPARKRRP